MAPLLQNLSFPRQSCRRAARIRAAFPVHASRLPGVGIRIRIGIGIEAAAPHPWLSENRPISTLDEYDSPDAFLCGFLRHGEPEKALTMYMAMQSEAVSNDLSGRCYLLLLKACIKAKNLDVGCHIHEQIVKCGLLQKDVFLGSTLVDMYSENGEILKAREVFESLSIRDVVTWSAIISACANHGYGTEGLTYFEEMQKEGFSPDPFTFTCTLKACSITKDTEKSQGLYDYLVRTGLEKNVVIASALVDLFVKCGSMAKAQEIFNLMMDRNVVSWNTLIAGYVEHGHGEEALRCFEQLQSAGISPDSVTYVCCLKSCSSILSIDRGKQIYSEITRKGFERDVTVGNTLIDMYIKCGFFLDARHVFNNLVVRALVSWNALIRGYVDDGNTEETLGCLKQMENDGILPDSITFSCCLKVYGSLGVICKVKEIHNTIFVKGFEGNLNVQNSLMDAYCKRGLLVEAKTTFNQIPARDVISWNILIAGYVQHGYSDLVVDYIDEMEFEICPDAVTLSHFLKTCSNLRALSLGQKTHAEIFRRGFETDKFIGICLIDMYAKCVSFLESMAVFTRLRDKTVFSWNALVGGYVKQELYGEACDLLQQMVLEGVSPDATTLVHCLKVCREESTIKTGQGIHKIIICKGLDDTEALLHSSLVDMYAKRGWLDDAEKVFDSIPVYCPFSWTTLITAFIDLGHVEELRKFLERMCVDRARTDLILLACMLRACSCIGDRGKGLAIHTEILLQGVEGDIIIGSAVIDLYVKFGWIVEAEAIFGKLQVRMVFAWTTLIAGYVYHGWDDCALDCFERMQEACVSPDDVTLACTLTACGNLGFESKGSKVFSYVAFKGLECDTYIGNSLVEMYAKCGLLAEAQEVFDGLSVKAEIAWTSLITGYSQAGETENAFMNFGRMLKGNVKPTGVTFISILSACSHGGLVEKGEYYFNVMVEDFESIPTLEHYGCMVDLLGRAGQLGNAVAVVEQMPYHPVNVVWLTLLGACQKWDNIRLGQEAFQHTQELNEDDIAPHISMSNMYINAGITENLSMLGECTR